MSDYRSLYRIRLLTGLIPGLLLTHAAAAQKLALADLPHGCIYSVNDSRPLTSSVKVSAGTPLFSEIGEGFTTLVNVGVQCTGEVPQDISLGIKENGTLNWLGAARDVLATDVSGIGVRLSTEGSAENGQCRGMGTLVAGRHAYCTISRDAQGERSLNFAVKAQLVKTGENTPLQIHKTLRIADSGSIIFSAKGNAQTESDLLNSGLLAPAISTEASCMLVTPADHNVSFGTISRPTAGPEITLGQPQSTKIEVACSPLRDDGANKYDVAISFTAGELKPGDETALATNIQDMAIRFTKSPDNSEWLKYGATHNMRYDSANSGDRSHFSETFYWHLRYLPTEVHTQNGNFSAVATYNVTIP